MRTYFYTSASFFLTLYPWEASEKALLDQAEKTSYTLRISTQNFTLVIIFTKQSAYLQHYPN
ncbi:hypothetical protein Runsl_3120 [Runella slithyformis DSM 19594]|uniref:Uncharacterized protein n=1 Tax=Runella slithyformis (strain ATCC 29530 / DSM 19594 / LMG 11500 / NCIMB 11436 / LSU 4) TaxID=761193 RepID=A0A7U3ZLP5_RUNSL|nr:hypothetical protein Runsl_3120 [Runella slithyformis DSM 19594]